MDRGRGKHTPGREKLSHSTVRDVHRLRHGGQGSQMQLRSSYRGPGRWRRIAGQGRKERKGGDGIDAAL